MLIGGWYGTKQVMPILEEFDVEHSFKTAVLTLDSEAEYFLSRMCSDCWKLCEKKSYYWSLFHFLFYLKSVMNY